MLRDRFSPVFCIPLLLLFGCATPLSQQFTVSPLHGQPAEMLDSDQKACDALAARAHALSSETKEDLALAIFGTIADAIGAVTGLPFGVASFGVSAGLLAVTTGVAASESNALAEPDRAAYRSCMEGRGYAVVPDERE